MDVKRFAHGKEQRNTKRTGNAREQEYPKSNAVTVPTGRTLPLFAFFSLISPLFFPSMEVRPPGSAITKLSFFHGNKHPRPRAVPTPPKGEETHKGFNTTPPNSNPTTEETARNSALGQTSSRARGATWRARNLSLSGDLPNTSPIPLLGFWKEGERGERGPQVGAGGAGRGRAALLPRGRQVARQSKVARAARRRARGLGAPRTDLGLTTPRSSLFVTIEHELPLEVISENLRLVNKST